ncbi:deoxynucleoside kinase [Cellvibrio japonicus]|uniref:Predicted deoxypurine kinase n=1 Tax=Cellvibrio japonicus (strain Ueda107) TaxID=498211 RepID=B3PI47_CELJU|nr:deoxynucleoside kinase [Cellvibrio japonicus]ACE84624.1 predicted deoxypurine kinase [Cellvibrio japonicus Ueda107]QEI11096.1 deoxynucleoside kinase [Cellvibrio japonicus]QEI14670.1 deoxynucleoside kinase [Cellvibrio japonicus]QEI18250.1 deoxynucleoside kinase [Cellvibrio japonicus]
MDAIFEELGLDLTREQLPRFIAVEGCIGVGKTTLARNLAQLFNYDTLLEQPEQNPFLERFYRDPKSTALPTQLFFLFQRANQIHSLRQNDLFEPVRVADFLIDKDQLFARVTLDDDEFAIYRQVYDKLVIDAPRPDLVIYLQAPLNVLGDRIRQRGIAAEQYISQDYLQALNDAYTEFFHYYDSAPLLIVNAQDLNLASNRGHFKQLVEYILTIKSGRHYYNPIPAL